MNHSLRGRLTATTVSQILTGVGNLILPLTVARTSPGATQFAYFSVAYLALSLMLTAVRLTSGDYLRIAYPDSTEPLLEIAWAKTRAIRIGATGLVMSSTMWLVGWPSRTPLILVAGLVGVCIAAAEASRSTLIASGRPTEAVKIDLTWAVPTVIGVVTLAMWSVSSPSAYLAVWGAGAAVAAIVSVIREPFTLKMHRPPSDPDPERRAQRSVLWKEFVVLRGGNQAMYFGAAALGGAAIIAPLAAGELTNRPLRLLNQIGLAGGIPEASRMRGRRSRVLRFTAVIGLVLAGACVLWWSVLIAAPDVALDAILGNSAPLVEDVLWPFAALAFASALQASARVATHGLNIVRRTLPGQVVVNLASIAVMLFFAASGNLEAVAWTLAVSTFATFLVLVGAARGVSLPVRASTLSRDVLA